GPLDEKSLRLFINIPAIEEKPHGRLVLPVAVTVVSEPCAHGIVQYSELLPSALPNLQGHFALTGVIVVPSMDPVDNERFGDGKDRRKQWDQLHYVTVS